MPFTAHIKVITCLMAIMEIIQKMIKLAVNYYAETKLLAEQEIKSGINYAIIRTNFWI